jgi:hypothetical protein
MMWLMNEGTMWRKMILDLLHRELGRTRFFLLEGDEAPRTTRASSVQPMS